MSKIKAEHLSRKAYIYIRQSTMEQVHKNQESRRFQYQLEDRAKESGWNNIVIIDEDLGRSGSGTVERTGYCRLLDDVLEGKVGVIFCVDPSRISRNNREWYSLLDRCAVMNTLIIDLHGIYDLNNLNDRMMLGMKGTMSEYEVSIFRHRAQSAIMEKAKRGELYRRLPAAYELTDDLKLEKSPDQRVQDSINLFFNKFQEFGTANQLFNWYQTENIELPCRDKNKHVIWKAPASSTIEGMLHNPIYAGAYAYGRTKRIVEYVNGVPRKYQKRLPIEEWAVLEKNHHPGYIGWDEYISNVNRLLENNFKNKTPGKGPAKNGAALLTRLVRCRRCGQRLTVHYDKTRPGNPCYRCNSKSNDGTRNKCISFFGQNLEQLIVKEVLRIVQPAAISAAEQAESVLSQKHQQKKQSYLNALKQAEYEVNRCFEQYNLVDPKNRLVANNLERRWNDALLKVEEIKHQLDQLDQQHHSLTEQDRKQLNKLADDLTNLWEHPNTDNKIKKRIIRSLVNEIVVDIAEDNNIVAIVHWAGGIHTEYRVKRNKKGQRPNHLHPDTLKLVQQLAEIVPDSKIAQIFNLLHIKTASGKNWDILSVSRFRHQHHIPKFDQAKYDEKGLVNLTQAAEILGTYPTTIRRMIKANIIKARQVVQYSPWIIEKEQLETPEVLRAIRKIKNGQKNALSKNQVELDL